MDYHPACAQKLYGTRQVPHLPYVRSEIGFGQTSGQSPDYIDQCTGQIVAWCSPRWKEWTWSFYDCRVVRTVYPETTNGHYRSLPELEDLTMHMAEAAKKLLCLMDWCVLPMTMLYHPTYRQKADGSKIAMEDMCQLTEQLTEYKYKGSYEQIAKAIRNYSLFRNSTWWTFGSWWYSRG